jgi:hypothetical protein
MNDVIRNFEVFREVKVYFVVFWLMTETCRLVDGYQCMRGTYGLHI